MKFYEKIDHMLRQYQYRRNRSSARDKNNNDFHVEEFLDEVDVCVGEVMEGIERIIKRRSP